MVDHQTPNPFNEKSKLSLNSIIGDYQIEKVASGFQFTEGPVWIPDGFLLFSDIPANKIFKWVPSNESEVFLSPSGHSNGLTLDREGRLLICEHDRRVSRLEKDGSKVTIAEFYKGKRLNSPNDIVVRTDGVIFFTDPPFGLPDRIEGKELDFSGVFRLDTDGSLTLLYDGIERPNGLALSPHENILYVDDSYTGHIYSFDVTKEALIENVRLFAEVGKSEGMGSADGMKVDVQGNVFCTGPGGISVFNPDGERFGIINCPEIPANIAWGDNDLKTLYITARTSVYRRRVKTGGLSLVPNFIPEQIL